MREDHQEAMDKMYPDGWLLVYTCPDGQIRYGMYNPHRDKTIEGWHQAFMQAGQQGPQETWRTPEEGDYE